MSIETNSPLEEEACRKEEEINWGEHDSEENSAKSNSEADQEEIRYASSSAFEDTTCCCSKEQNSTYHQPSRNSTTTVATKSTIECKAEMGVGKIENDTATNPITNTNNTNSEVKLDQRQMNVKMQGLLRHKGMLEKGTNDHNPNTGEEVHTPSPRETETNGDNLRWPTTSFSYSYKDAYKTAKNATVGLVGGTMSIVGGTMAAVGFANSKNNEEMTTKSPAATEGNDETTTTSSSYSYKDAYQIASKDAYQNAKKATAGLVGGMMTSVGLAKSNNGQEMEATSPSPPPPPPPATESNDENQNSTSSSYTYKDAYQTAKKATVGVVGGTMTAVGLVMIPLPTPFGVVVAGSGLAVLGTEYPQAQELLESSRDTLVSAIETHVITDDDESDISKQEPEENKIGTSSEKTFVETNRQQQQQDSNSRIKLESSSSLDDNQGIQSAVADKPLTPSWLEREEVKQEVGEGPITSTKTHPEHHDRWEQDGIIYVPETIKSIGKQMTKTRKQVSRTARHMVPILKSIGANNQISTNADEQLAG